MRKRTFLIAAFAAMIPASALAQEPPAPLGLITPQNELERAFLEALRDENRREAFRREFLVSRIALAMASDASDAPPREVQLNGEVSAAAVFTSTTRLNSVLGPASARQVMSGREALTLLRNKNVVLNYRLTPMLTLEPEDVAEWLEEGQ